MSTKNVRGGPQERSERSATESLRCHKLRKLDRKPTEPPYRSRTTLSIAVEDQNTTNAGGDAARVTQTADWD